MRRALWGLAALAAAALLGGGAAALALLRASLPALDGSAQLAGLDAPVRVSSDRFGIPAIRAQSREDALRALGYLSARDRLFQMDLQRRASAGQLAEILGPELVPSDARQRALEVPAVAAAIAAALPPRQRAALDAYAQGVNAYLAAARRLPFEFELLGYRPQPWSAQDSALVTLGMFQALNGSEAEERMRSALERCVPEPVRAFLLPAADRYTRALLGGAAAEPPPLPLAELRALRERAPAPLHAARVRPADSPRGSNAWVVAGSRTPDGRAILANDMHLDLGVPNIWYRAELRYGDVSAAGVVLPGLPALVAGSNGHVAWGLTSLDVDVLDLVALELHPDDPEQYRTPEGWRRIERRSDAIRVRGGPDVPVEIRSTVFGPLAPEPLLGAPVAVHWSGLDPAAVDVGWMELAEARTLEDALGAANRAAGPGANALLADAGGRIAWTLTGRLPRRRGSDGSASRSRADGAAAWDGYLRPEELPRVLDPAEGFWVSANQRTRETDAVAAGHDYANGYRAWRIGERLRALERAGEPELFAIALDTRAEFFEPYRELALRALRARPQGASPLLAQAQRALETWDGQAEPESVGLAWLVRWRRALAEELFGPWLAQCRAQDAEFEFAAPDLDTPLLQLLEARPAELVPAPAADWDAFLLAALERAGAELRERAPREPLERFAWGAYNQALVEHPLAGALPGIGRWLSMPREPLAGCGFCVRMADGVLGASERLAVSPGREADGLLHMPGGQSGHPLSPHYRDQHEAWVQGRPLPFLAGAAQHVLVLLPAAVGSAAQSARTNGGNTGE